MKVNNEKFPISNEALDQSKRELMKLPLTSDLQVLH